jgi:hypothetical protein
MMRLLSLLEMSSIIIVCGNDAKTIALADDYDTKWQITVGDGLSQMRMSLYNNTIDVAAMTRVLMIQGDLYGGVLHFLVIVFVLYYGASWCSQFSMHCWGETIGPP